MRSGALPARRTELIGRDADVRAASALLQGDTRLVTLTGAGGVGKTTLALEVARAVADDVPDGVHLVDLAILPAGAPAEEVAAACARALGLADERRPPLDAVIEHLRARLALLVFDNCEHLPLAVARVADRLLDACPYVRLLATSRARLHVPGEAVRPVQPLAAPPPSLPVEDLGAVDSVRLFVLHAAAADPAFSLGAGNVEDVASICRRLDGNPLAIELAAAHVQALSPADIAARLGLEDGLLHRRGAPIVERQHTLERAIAWSHDLLSDDDQRLFRRLAVFAAPWTLDGAEAVCGGAGRSGAVAAGLATLVDQSLVVRLPGDPPRYSFPPPIADFAAARLDASGDRDAVAAAHAAMTLGVVGARAQRRFALPEELDRIEASSADAHAALHWATSAGRLDIALGLVAALMEWWRIRGHLRDAQSHLDALLGRLAGHDSPPTAMLHAYRADVRRLLGRLDEARSDSAASAAMAERLADDVLARAASAMLGDVAASAGDIDGALAAYDAAAARYPLPMEGAVPAFWRANRGMIGLRGGNRRLTEALADLGRANELLSTGERTWYRGRVLAALGTAEGRAGDLAPARTHLEAGFGELAAYGARVDAIEALEELGIVVLGQGDAWRSAALIGAASGLRDAIGLEVEASDRARRVAAVEQARRALGTARFEQAWLDGRASSIAEAGGLAAGMAALRHGPARGNADANAPGAALTAREREVVALVADGLTNPQIAERLFISAGTVRTHVERILGKLGLTRRVQVARWYAEHADR